MAGFITGGADTALVGAWVTCGFTGVGVIFGFLERLVSLRSAAGHWQETGQLG